ncbi:MAG: PorP/SprF family type IX secretion system membrane protein [Marinifilaceae bacterium]
MLLFCVPFSGVGQDFHFSLFDQNRTYYNPAMTGLQKGVIQSNFVYRKQWINMPGDFSTKHFNVDWKGFGPNGFGVFVLSDVEGDSFLTHNSIGGNYSWRGTIDKISGTYFQLGLKASYNIQKLDFDRLVFTDELDDIYGDIFESSYVADQNRCSYIDFSVGGMICLRSENIFGNELTHKIGGAVHHFTRPNESLQGGEEKLPVKIVFHAQSEYQTRIRSLNRRNYFRITPSVVYESQGTSLFSKQSANSFMGGFDFNSEPLNIGLGYRSHLIKNSNRNYDVMMFKIGARFDNSNKNLVYRIFYCYDLAINNYTKYTRDSHEIGLSVDILFKRKYKCTNSF